MSDIDKFEVGKLVEKVEHLDKELDEVKGDVKSLLKLANKSKGAFWGGMTIASLAGSIITIIFKGWWNN